MFWPFACRRQQHRAPRVVALGVEIRGDPHLNDLKPYVRFYLECQKCGAKGDKLRETGKTFTTPEHLILTPAYWDEVD
jgi:hypothetical protein